MDAFMTYIITSLQKAADTSNAVFPPASCVLLLFTERLGTEIVAEYVNGLLTRAKEVDAEIVNVKQAPNRRSGIMKSEEDWPTPGAQDQGQGPELYLQATAAGFVVCWKVVDTLVESGDGTVERKEAEAIVYVLNMIYLLSIDVGFRFRIFDPHMDEYLDEEVEAVKRSFDVICREWTAKVRTFFNQHFHINPDAGSEPGTQFDE